MAWGIKACAKMLEKEKAIEAQDTRTFLQKAKDISAAQQAYSKANEIQRVKDVIIMQAQNGLTETTFCNPLYQNTVDWLIREGFDGYEVIEVQNTNHNISWQSEPNCYAVIKWE